MNLQDALTDLKSEAIRGNVVTDELVAEVAADYSINPKLLRRSFDASYPNPELLANTAAATSATAHRDAEREQTISYFLRLYGVTRGQLFDVHFGTDRYTVIGRIDSQRYLAVRFSDATGWRLPVSGCKAVN